MEDGSLVWGMVCGESQGIVEAMVRLRQLGPGVYCNAALVREAQPPPIQSNLPISHYLL